MVDTPINLKEYTSVKLSPEKLPYEVGESLWEDYGTQISVEFPSPKTQNKWVLTNQGYGGRIQVTPEWSFILKPKTSIKTILGMLECAYELESFEFLDGLSSAGSLTDYFDRVAKLLAQKVVTRQQKGLHKNYVRREEETTTVKGRIDFKKTLRKPWDPNPSVSYRNLTVDIEDNQILLWTLRKILSSDVPSQSTIKIAKRAYRPMVSEISMERFRADECVGREYRRLNQDYETLHSLCHLILDSVAPTRSAGNNQMMPFVVDMARLYESFVAKWLDDNLPSQYTVTPQEPVEIGDSGREYDVDLVFYSGSDPIAVADTKYKTPSKPATDDISQVIAYAEAKGVEKAFLVYPENLDDPIDTTVGDIDVGTLTFGVDDDLDTRGKEFVTDFNRSVMSAYGLSPM